MKRLYPFSLLIFFLVSCLDESSVSPIPTDTFVRYYNGGNNDKASDFEITADEGFIILATTEIPSGDPSKSSNFRIKLIRTTDQGVIDWQAYFPDVPYGDGDPNLKFGFRAKSIDIGSDGNYVVAGENLVYNSLGAISSSKAFLLKVSSAGVILDTASYPLAARGDAITFNDTGDILLLSSKPGSMYLSQIDKTSNAIVQTAPWTNLILQPSTNSLYIDHLISGRVVWVGSEVTGDGTHGVRITTASQINPSPGSSNLLVAPTFERSAADLTRFGEGYISVGSSNEKVDGNGDLVLGTDKDIQFIRYNSDLTQLAVKGFPIVKDISTGVNDGQDDFGNGVYPTLDGGVILLGTVDSKAIGGRGETDFMLIKVNSLSGEEEWRTHFGSKFKDAGVGVRQNSHGNFIVLGNTNQGGLDMIMLARTDKNGNIQ